MIAAGHAAFVIALSMQAAAGAATLVVHDAALGARPDVGASAQNDAHAFRRRETPLRVRGLCPRVPHPALRVDFAPTGRGDSGAERNTFPSLRAAAPDAGPAGSLDIRQNEWFGNDKLRHFLMSMAFTQFMYGGLRTASADDDVALPIAIGAAAVAGIGKEMYDVRNAGPFNLKDLMWDAAGIIVAGLILGSVR